MKVARCMGLSVCTALVATACFAGYEQALSAFKAGDYDRASALFRQFVEEQPQAFVGHVMLGHSLLSAGRPSEAVPPYQQALELKPDDVVRIYLGRALYKTDRFEECASALNRLDLEALPTEAQRSMFRLRCACHAHAGNARSAAADLGRLADLKPDDAEARFLQGRWLESDGDFRAAIRAYEQATSIDGNGQEYRHALARALVMAGRTAEGVWSGRSFYSKAAEEAKELVRSHPTSENLILLGEAHLGSTAFRKAGAALPPRDLDRPNQLARAPGLWGSALLPAPAQVRRESARVFPGPRCGERPVGCVDVARPRLPEPGKIRRSSGSLRVCR